MSKVRDKLLENVEPLKRFALRLCKDETNAQDLLHDTLERCLTKEDMYREEAGSSLFSWMSKVMFNIFASRYRHVRKFHSQYDPAPFIEMVQIGPNQEHVTDLNMVKNIMRQLSREHQQILQLAIFEGKKYDEISAMLSIPVGTVRSRISRARKLLQNAL